VKSNCSENPNIRNSLYFQKTTIQAFRKIFWVASNMLSRFTSMEQGLLKQMECPVCMEYMRPPITLCVNGHNICNTCKPKVLHCPTCRQQFLDTRNVALEQLAAEVLFPCAYRNYGCRETYKLDLIGEHQQKCRYIPQPCPVNKLNLGNCTWTGICSKMYSHLKQKHNNICIDYQVRDFHGNIRPHQYSGFMRANTCIECQVFGSVGNSSPLQIRGVTPATTYCKLILCDNNVFFSRSEIKNGIFYSVLQYIGPAAEAAKYQYKLQFLDKERKVGLLVSFVARSLYEDLSEVHNSGNSVKLYPEQFSGFVNERSELEFSMEIVKLTW